MPIKNSIGFYLSRDLFSPMDSPSFNQSAMDGYAIKFSKSKNYTVVGESKAGLAKKYNIEAIFSGHVHHPANDHSDFFQSSTDTPDGLGGRFSGGG